jgi:hypothetical protein
MSDLNIFGEDVALTLPRPAPSRGLNKDLSVADHLKGSTKKTKKPDHNARTRDLFLSRGFIYTRIDRYNAYAGTTHDLFGMWDSMAFNPTMSGVTAIQITSVDGMGIRLRKSCDSEIDTVNKIPRASILRAWLASGNRFLIIGWELRKVGNVNRWIAEERFITEADIAQVEARRRKK